MDKLELINRQNSAPRTKANMFAANPCDMQNLSKIKVVLDQRFV